MENQKNLQQPREDISPETNVSTLLPSNATDATLDNPSPSPALEAPLVFPAADVKYFVGGFHSDVTEKELKNHFSTFGPVSDVKIMRDATSGRSRGFGFVTMSEPSSKQRIMAEKEHIIGGRKTSVRPYAEQADLKDSFTDGPILKRKVFVGGINPALGREALENYFGKYGLLEDATIMRYPDGRSRGFGFVVFRDETVCQQVLRQRNHCITPRDKVEVKPCLSRGKTKLPGAQGGMMPGGMDAHYGHSFNMMRAPYAAGPAVVGYSGYGYGPGANYNYGNSGPYGMYGSNVPNGMNPSTGAAGGWTPYDSYGNYYGNWAGTNGYSANAPRNVVSSGNISTPNPSSLPRMNSENYFDMSSGVAQASTPNSLVAAHPGYAPIRRGPAGGGMPPPGLVPPYSQGIARGRIAPY